MTLYKNPQNLLGTLDCSISNFFRIYLIRLTSGIQIELQTTSSQLYIIFGPALSKKDGPNPSAMHRNDTALGTLVLHAPHSVSNKVMDYMYNPFDIVPIIFEETQAKR
uniref:Uncharacterized protein n=1 Tax=Romanomermis culicivorax TaxID=13658 RepID=A0A915JRV1_ROMCU